MRRRPGTYQIVTGTCIVAFFIVLAVFPGALSHTNPNQIVARPLLPPSGKYWLGTDEVGRDIFSRVVHGGGTVMLVSLFAALLASAIGTILGVVAGYLRGFVDRAISEIVTVLLAFPALVLALFFITVFGRGSAVELLAITLVSAPGVVRLCRAVTLSLRTRPYIEASRIASASSLYIIRRHLIPNAAPTIIVATSLLAANAVLTVAALSYLGLGVQPPNPSWGNLLQASYNVAFQSPWYGIAPGVCITLVALGYTLIGNGLRVRLGTETGTWETKAVHA